MRYFQAETRIRLGVVDRHLLRRIARAILLAAAAFALIWLLGLALGYLFGPFAGMPIGQSPADYG